MKIYTKTGDKGTTALIGGVRVPKHNLRIEAYGTVDELNSYLGLLRDLFQEKEADILEIQDRLFTMGSLLAEAPKGSKMVLPQISDADITFLEKGIDAMDEQLEPLKSFVLPGGHVTVSHSHIARCVCRRAERLVALLNDENEGRFTLQLSYLNRLSDYIFTLSRYISKVVSANEIPWKPRV